MIDRYIYIERERGIDRWREKEEREIEREKVREKKIDR